MAPKLGLMTERLGAINSTMCVDLEGTESAASHELAPGTWTVVRPARTSDAASRSDQLSETERGRPRSRSRDPAIYEDAGLAAVEVKDVIRRTEVQIEEERGRLRCCGCQQEMLKSQLLPLCPFHMNADAQVQIYCYDCVQCKNDKSPWNWFHQWQTSEDDITTTHERWLKELDKDPMYRVPATEIPFATATTPSFATNPNADQAPVVQLHGAVLHETASSERVWVFERRPMYQGNETYNQRSFKRDAKRGWVQFAICNRGRYQASARDLDFQKLREKIEAEHGKLSQRLLRTALFSDVTSFAEAFAKTMFSGPHKERQAKAFQNFDENMKQLAYDVNFKIAALDDTFGTTRFHEYLDRVTGGVNQHFICQEPGCKRFFPSDCWIQAYKPHTGGTAELPNLWQYRCPYCSWAYGAHKLLEDGTFGKNGWTSQLPLVPAHKIMAVEDFYQGAPVHTRTAESNVTFKNSALDTTDERLTAACMQRDGYTFFLCHWEDKVTETLMKDLKIIWNQVREACENTDPKALQKITLDLAAQSRQQAYFKDEQVPKSVIEWCDTQNASIGPKARHWSYKILPKNEHGPVVPQAAYTYTPGDTHILTVSDQCRFWAYTSFNINLALKAEQMVSGNTE